MNESILREESTVISDPLACQAVLSAQTDRLPKKGTHVPP
jgi:hypothetical protein